MGAWGWRVGTSWLGWTLAVALPLGAAVMWGTFAVPGDPSRSGGAPVPVSGVLRLCLEFCFFAVAVVCLRSLGWGRAGAALALVVVLHYLASYDRMLWLVRQ